MEPKVEVHLSARRDEEEEEEKLNLYFKVIKTVALRAKKSETVRNVKAILKDQEGIPECLQEIFFGGDWLQDDKMLVDCGIKQNSTLKIFVQNSEPLTLNIKIPSDKKVILVQANIYDSIQDVKSLISAKEGIHSDGFTLIHAGKALEDDKTLASLNIQGESTLHMVTKPRYMLPISVKMPSGEMLKIEVNVLLKVFIRPGCGKTMTLDVCSNALVKDVKDKIALKLRLPAHLQDLVFEGKSLNDARNLATYDIQRHSTLTLSLRHLIVKRDD